MKKTRIIRERSGARNANGQRRFQRWFITIFRLGKKRFRICSLPGTGMAKGAGESIAATAVGVLLNVVATGKRSASQRQSLSIRY